jgi:hypothetical protein
MAHQPYFLEQRQDGGEISRAGAPLSRSDLLRKKYQAPARTSVAGSVTGTLYSANTGTMTTDAAISEGLIWPSTTVLMIANSGYVANRPKTANTWLRV